jgi:hypothetical protein
LYTLSTKLPPTQDEYLQSFVDQIMKNNWTRVMQLDEAITFIKAQLTKTGATFKVDVKEFEIASGVGINLSDDDIQKLVDQ